MVRNINDRDLYRHDFPEDWEYKAEFVLTRIESAIETVVNSQREASDRMLDAVAKIAASQEAMSGSIDRLAAAIESAAVSQARGMAEASERLAVSVNSASKAVAESQVSSGRDIAKSVQELSSAANSIYKDYASNPAEISHTESAGPEWHGGIEHWEIPGSTIKFDEGEK